MSTWPGSTNWLDLSWEEVGLIEPYTPIASAPYNEGIRWQIRRGFAALNAYIGISSNSPAANTTWDELGEIVPVHGGFTFGPSEMGEKGWIWWGWDYAHYRDRGYMDGVLGREGFIEWTPAMVKDELDQVLPEFDAWLRANT